MDFINIHIIWDNLKSLIQHRRYDIDPRPAARVKLLYAIDRHAIEDLIDSEDPEEITESATQIHTFNTTELFLNLSKVRQALHSYSRKMKIFQSVQNGSIVNRNEGSLFSLDRFGDSGMGGTGTLDRTFKDVDDFFGDEGFKLLNTEPGSSSRDNAVVRDIEFGFTDSWSLKYIKLFLIEPLNKKLS